MAEMMDEESGYRPDSGDFDDLKEKPEAQVSLNPASVEGLNDYRPGDTVNLTLKVRWPKDAQPGQMADFEVVSARAEEMDGSARVARQRSENGMY